VTTHPGSPAGRPLFARALRLRRRGRLMPEAADEWGRPPEPVTHYGPLARLSDMTHGWLDGRRGLPYLPPMMAEPGDGSSVPALDGPSLPVPAAPAPGQRPVPDRRLNWLMTPRMVVWSTWAMEQIKAEEETYWDDCAAWQKELHSYSAIADELAEKLTAAKERLELAQRPLTDQERKARRLSEQDPARRPENFVAERRQAGWERRLRAAEEAYQSVAARHARAVRQVQLREEQIRARLSVARAAAGRHYELAMRRIATYQQQLVRRHRRGHELNLLLMSHPVGPDLPAWVTDPDADPPRGGRWTSEPSNGEETSNP
jgi:hypothetical protein